MLNIVLKKCKAINKQYLVCFIFLSIVVSIYVNVFGDNVVDKKDLYYEIANGEDLEETTKYFEQELERLNKKIKNSPEKKERLYSQRGAVNRELGHFKEALKDFNKALKLEKSVWIYGERGILKRKTGDLKGALKDFNKALNLEKSAWIYKERGILKRKIGDFEGALKDFDEALNLEKNIWILSEIGITKEKLGDLKGSLNCFDDALLLEQDAWVYSKRGLIKRELGDLEGALKDFNEALKIRQQISFSSRELNVEDFKKAYSVNPGLDWIKRNIKELESKQF